MVDFSYKCAWVGLCNFKCIYSNISKMFSRSTSSVKTCTRKIFNYGFNFFNRSRTVQTLYFYYMFYFTLAVGSSYMTTYVQVRSLNTLLGVFITNGCWFPVSHMIVRVNNQDSSVYCVPSIFWLLRFVFSHPMMSTKCPSLSAASGGKRERYS